jgi:DNA polymerase-3 subunit delta'
MEGFYRRVWGVSTTNHPSISSRWGGSLAWQGQLRYNQPMTMDDNWEMLGHSWAVELLKNHLANNRTRHAYLFTGPSGIGRRTLALRLAQALNCIQPVNPGVPCGTCRNCRLIPVMQHPDVSISQADQVGGTLKVDQIRELQHTLSLTPYEAQYRVALLLRFEEANPSAANALLKTLEEPPPCVVLMLTAQDSQSLLPTIVSRCELVRLRPLSLGLVSEGLQAHFGVEAESARLLAHISGGRPGYAIRLHQDPEFMKKRQSWLEEHQRLLSANRLMRFAFAETLASDKDDLESVLRVWSSFWRDIFLTTSGSSSPLTNIDWKKEIQMLASTVTLSKAVEMVKSVENTSDLLTRNINARLAIEVLTLDLPYIKGG